MTRREGAWPILTVLGPPAGWVITRFFDKLEAAEVAQISHASYMALLEVVKVACN